MKIWKDLVIPVRQARPKGTEAEMFAYNIASAKLKLRLCQESQKFLSCDLIMNDLGHKLFKNFQSSCMIDYNKNFKNDYFIHYCQLYGIHENVSKWMDFSDFLFFQT